MPRATSIVLLILLASSNAGPLAAFPGEAPDQRALPDMDNALPSFDAVIELVKDVRFDEADLRKLIELWDDFQQFTLESDLEMADNERFVQNPDGMLHYPAYIAWAKKHGLDREDWLKKMLRVQLLLTRQEYLAQAPNASAEMAKARAELEKMRDQLGEEAYQQMLQAFDAGSQMMGSMRDSLAKLPMPTEKERSLLAKYQKELKRLR